MKKTKKPSGVDVPVLFPCDSDERDGWVDYEIPVKALTPADWDPSTSSGKKTIGRLSREEWELVTGVGKLRIGFRHLNPRFREEACNLLRFLTEHQTEAEANENRRLTRLVAESPESCGDMLAPTISRHIESVRLVVWWAEKDRRIVPALFSRTIATAILTQAILGFGGSNIRICPNCSHMFLTRRLDQQYCTDRCRDTARMRRYRTSKQAA